MTETTNVISAFSAEHVARVTGLTPRQLAYWSQTHFFQPRYADLEMGARPMKIYSFEDVVGLRVIAVLLKEHAISVQRLRKFAVELRRRSESPWSSLKLMVCRGEVAIYDPAARRGEGIFSGQYVLVPIIDQIRHVQRAAQELSKRRPEQVGSIEQHRNIAHNARVFAGTRIPVRAVERFLEAGYTVDAILEEYPSLARDDVEFVKREKLARAA